MDDGRRLYLGWYRLLLSAAILGERLTGVDGLRFLGSDFLGCDFLGSDFLGRDFLGGVTSS